MTENRLLDLKKSLKAKFANNNSFQIPESYGDAKNEAILSREQICFSDISSRGKVKISGKDHLKLLNGMLTNDVLKLDPGKGRLACILTNKGKIISDMRLYKDEESVYLDLEPELNSKVVGHLSKFRLSYKAQIDDLTDEFHLLHIFGPESEKIMGERFGIQNDIWNEYDHLAVNGLKIFKVNRTGETGFDILFKTENENSILDIIGDQNSDFIPVGSRAMEILRVEAGIAKYGQDMDENTIPIEAGLWNALDFEKGCYVGQEVVARIKWRGRVNRHLVNLDVESKEIPNPKDRIYSGDKLIGKITSSVYSPRAKRVIALGYIRREFRDEGSKAELIFQNGNKTVVTVREKAFFNNFI